MEKFLEIQYPLGGMGQHLYWLLSLSDIITWKKTPHPHMNKKQFIKKFIYNETRIKDWSKDDVEWLHSWISDSVKFSHDPQLWSAYRKNWKVIRIVPDNPPLIAKLASVKTYTFANKEKECLEHIDWWNKILPMIPSFENVLHISFNDLFTCNQQLFKTLCVFLEIPQTDELYSDWLEIHTHWHSLNNKIVSFDT